MICGARKYLNAIICHVVRPQVIAMFAEEELLRRFHLARFAFVTRVALSRPIDRDSRIIDDAVTSLGDTHAQVGFCIAARRKRIVEAFELT
jgi:hypothetical protein